MLIILFAWKEGDIMGRKPLASSSTPNKVFGVRINEELVKRLKILAIEENTSAYKLLEEAVTMLLSSRKQHKKVTE